MITSPPKTATHPSEPSAWIRRWTPLLSPGTTVLDVACGRGRHLRWLAAQGHRVTGVDRDAAALAGLRDLGEIVQADLEAAPWPFAGRRFGAVVIVNYLWRPLMGALAASVDEGGVLLYETFVRGQEGVGRPRNPAFLLEPGELLRHFAQPDWHVVAFEDGFEARPRARFVQRIVAVRRPHAQDTAAAAAATDRYLLLPG